MCSDQGITGESLEPPTAICTPSWQMGATVEDTRLGPREQQVLKYLVDGLSYKEIAGELGITNNTVGTCVQRIYEKLQVRSCREIISYYRGAGHDRNG
jgi:DNA-binding NarL/FixJ family response regulator